MFKCKKCHKQSNKGDKAFMKVIEVRNRALLRDKDGKSLYDKEGTALKGMEIAKEIQVCRACNDKED